MNCKNIANFIVEEIKEYNRQHNFQKRISLTNRRLQLLLYFCEIEYMKKNNGTPLFTSYHDDFMAWPGGPTIIDIVRLYSQYSNGEMCLSENISSVELKEDIKTIIYEILEATKNIDTHDLMNISNVVDGPWHQAYSRDDKFHKQIISKEEMYRYYSSRKLFKSANEKINMSENIKMEKGNIDGYIISQKEEIMDKIIILNKKLRENATNFSTFTSLGKSKIVPVFGDDLGISVLTVNPLDFPKIEENSGYTFLKHILTSDNVSNLIQSEEFLWTLLDDIPELKDMIGFAHKHPHHHLDVWEHTMLALEISPNDFDIRLALLLHDIGKPHCFQEGEVRHFKGHAKVSSQIAFNILKRLSFDEDKINEICYLIEQHDTPITKEEINNNRELVMKKFEIQCCDALAHNPLKLEKRIAYLNSINELINNEEDKTVYKILIKKYLNNKK